MSILSWYIIAALWAMIVSFVVALLDEQLIQNRLDRYLGKS